MKHTPEASGTPYDHVEMTQLEEPVPPTNSDYMTRQDFNNFAQSLGPAFGMHERRRLPRLRTILALGASVVALGAAAAVYEKIEGIHLPSISLFGGPPKAAINGDTYFTHLTYPAAGIVGMTEGGADLTATTTGGALLDVNIPYVGNPTQRSNSASRKGITMLTLNNIPENVSVKLNKGANATETTTVTVDTAGLELIPGGIECATTKSGQCKASSSESLLDEARPIIPLALLLAPAARIPSLIGKIAGVGVIGVLSDKLLGPKVNVASRTESLAKDADYAYVNSCGEGVLAQKPHVIAGLKKLLSAFWSVNAAYDATDSARAKTLSEAARGPIDIVLRKPDGSIISGSQVQVRSSVPQPTTAMIAKQFGGGLHASDVTLSKNLFTCTYRDPSAANNASARQALQNQRNAARALSGANG